jgi:hypothetical protein
MIGIYEIVHRRSGRTYIGSSDNIERRLKAHRSMLRRGIHDNIRLQRTWNRDGAECFIFRVRERCPIHALRDREAAIIKNMLAQWLYNFSPVVRRGARAPNSSADDRTVRLIYRRAAAGESVNELARAFDLPLFTIQRIVAGTTYTRITKGKPARPPVRATGSRIGQSKLTSENVTTIRSRLDSGELGAHIARDYGVSPRTIYMIRDRETWR